MEADRNWNRRFGPLALGSILSAVCIFGAYGLRRFSLLPGDWLMFALVGLGCVQAAIQLVFFFHFGKEGKPYWNSLLFICSFLLILIVVWGTFWILSHLNMNLMPWMYGEGMQAMDPDL